MTEMISKENLLSFFEREVDRWLCESNRLSSEMSAMRARGIPGTSIEFNRAALLGLAATDRAFVMMRLYDTIGSWDDSTNMDELDLSCPSKEDLEEKTGASIRRIGELIGADEETTERMIEITRKVVNE